MRPQRQSRHNELSVGKAEDPGRKHNAELTFEHRHVIGIIAPDQATHPSQIEEGHGEKMGFVIAVFNIAKAYSNVASRPASYGAPRSK